MSEFERDGARRIGRFVILEELGRGGQGVVYLARDETLGRRVALKILLGGALLSGTQRERFLREAKAVSRLDHPGLCTVYDSDVTDGTPWIAMRLVQGESLAARISRLRVGNEARTDSQVFIDFSSTVESTRNGDEADTLVMSASRSTSASVAGRADIEAAVEIIEKCARALHAAHEAGLVHRDIKPGNIMLTDELEPVLLDFGLARDDQSGDTLTGSADLLGTPAYMSPEQISGPAANLDRRTDVYSLGATLYECLTLERPHSGATRQALYASICSGIRPSPRVLNPKISADLAVVLDMAMEVDLERRYASAGAFADDLKRWRRREPVRARPTGPLLRSWRWSQRHPVRATSLVMLIVALSVVTWLAASLATSNSELSRANTEYDRLAASRRLDDLLEDAHNLWPPSPNKEAMTVAWLDRARGLVEQLPDLRKALAEIRSCATPETRAEIEARMRAHDDQVGIWKRELAALEESLDKIGESGGDSGELANLESIIAMQVGDDERTVAMRAYLERARDILSELARTIPDHVTRLEARQELPPPDRVRWSFRDDDSAAFRHDALMQLIERLEKLDAERGGGDVTIASVEDHLLRIRRVAALQSEEQADLWEDAADRVADSSRYGDCDLEPVPGFLPIGPDPQSGFEEFACVYTGAVPVRDEDGRLVLEPRSAAIFVLLPAARNLRVGSVKDSDSGWNEMRTTVPHLAPFLMGKHEVTQGQWRRIMGSNPSTFRPPAHDRLGIYQVIDECHPVETVNWREATELARRCGALLPTEAQWEYAARAGGIQRFSWGHEYGVLEGRANCAGREAELGVKAVGGLLASFTDPFYLHSRIDALPPNAFGLHCTHGNVREWCRDTFRVQSVFSAEDPEAHNVAPPTQEDLRVLRGGSFYDHPRHCRVTRRTSSSRGATSSIYGVRLSARLAQ